MTTNDQHPIFAPQTFKYTHSALSGLKSLLEGRKHYLFLLFLQTNFLSTYWSGAKWFMWPPSWNDVHQTELALIVQIAKRGRWLPVRMYDSNSPTVSMKLHCSLVREPLVSKIYPANSDMTQK